MTPDEIDHWETNGYFMRKNVFSHEENDQLRQVAEDIAIGKRKMPMAHIDQNAQDRDGKDKRSGIYAMHKIHHPSCYIPEFFERVRDIRLTDPLVDILGPDILGINNLFIWKAPEIGLGFPWHQDKFYFGKSLRQQQRSAPGPPLTRPIAKMGASMSFPAAMNRTFPCTTTSKARSNKNSNWPATKMASP